MRSVCGERLSARLYKRQHGERQLTLVGSVVRLVHVCMELLKVKTESPSMPQNSVTLNQTAPHTTKTQYPTKLEFSFHLIFMFICMFYQKKSKDAHNIHTLSLCNTKGDVKGVMPFASPLCFSLLF